MNNKKQNVNVICINWGGKYKPAEINSLFRAVKKNIHKYKLNFYCFSDVFDDFDSEIILKEIPNIPNISRKIFHAYAWQKEPNLCDDNLGGLNGQRVLFLDTDTLITGNLDCFFEIPKNDEFYIIKDWANNNNRVGQASCYSWKVGTLGFIRDYFAEHSEEIWKKYFSASQEYLSDKVIEKYGKLNFWPRELVSSFKYTILPSWPLRFFVIPKLPKNTRILCFHGHPKIEEVYYGKWKRKHWWNIFYKKVRATKWLSRYADFLK